MQRRAEAEQQTRLRITESTVHLHGTLGPARTTVSAIAEHARVRRSTVYRHFPDEAALFAACSAHWQAANPVPAIEAWASVEDPDARLRRALAELYDYYGHTVSMMQRILRDEEMPIVKRMLDGYRGYVTAARGALLRGRRESGQARRHVGAAIGHALAFATWRSLTVEQGLSQADAVDLMCRLASAARRQR